MPGDRLRIDVYVGTRAISEAGIVDATGYLGVPMLAPFAVRGETVAEIRADVAARLAGRFHDPIVVVSFEEASHH